MSCRQRCFTRCFFLVYEFLLNILTSKLGTPSGHRPQCWRSMKKLLDKWNRSRWGAVNRWLQMSNVMILAIQTDTFGMSIPFLCACNVPPKKTAPQIWSSVSTKKTLRIQWINEYCTPPWSLTFLPPEQLQKNPIGSRGFPGSLFLQPTHGIDPWTAEGETFSG